MDDEEYAQELFEILTRAPDPDVAPWQLGDDFIDRNDGFGTDLRVTAIDVVPGAYGSQLDIAFVLDVPYLGDAPATGSLLLPLDREWRGVCGYEVPEDYAPIVAMRLMRSIHKHVEPRRDGPRPRRDLPPRDVQWDLLLERMSREGEAEEVAPGRIVVRPSSGRTDLTVILTPEQWEQVLDRHGIPQTGTFDFYDELLGSTCRDQRFLVFWEGELVASTREQLPPTTPPTTPLREIRRRLAEAKATGATLGWFAYRPDATEEELPG